LEPAFSFESTLQDEVTDDGGTTAGYDSYVSVTDDTGTIKMDVPAEWSDTSGAFWAFDGGDDVGVAITAAAEIDAWLSGWTTPGVFFGASSALRDSYTVDSLLDWESFSQMCTYQGREAYEDPLYTGAYDVYADCDGQDMLFVVLAAEPTSGAFIMLLQIIVVDDRDLEALDTILATFVADEAAMPTAIGATTTTSTTTTTVASGGSTGTVTLGDMQPGQCFDDTSLMTETTLIDAPITLIDCSQPHDNEVYQRYNLSGGVDYPGEDAVADQMWTACMDAFSGYVGAAYDDSVLDFFFLYPLDESWAAGERFGICALWEMTGSKLEGSAYQSGW